MQPYIAAAQRLTNVLRSILRTVVPSNACLCVLACNAGVRLDLEQHQEEGAGNKSAAHIAGVCHVSSVMPRSVWSLVAVVSRKAVGSGWK